MSIINQMLQKLEKRHGGREASLPDGVRAVATPSQARRPLALGVLVAALVAGGGYYGWTWWQQRAKPAKSVAVAGKIPGAAPEPVAPIPEPLPVNKNLEEEKLLAEVAQKLLDEAEKSEQLKKNGQPGQKKKSLSGEVAEADTAKPLNEVSQGLVKKTNIPAGISRESGGKIKPYARDFAAEQAMKSVSPQQQALFYYQKALSWLQQGRVAEARSGLEEALKLDAYHLATRQALAALMVEQRQYQLAETLMQEGLNLNAEQYGFAMALARLQVERGDTRSALDTLFKSLPHATDNAGYQAFIAALLQRDEQHKKAIEHYQAALRLASSGAWQVGLAISFQAENRLAEAQEAFAHAKASSDLSPELTAFIEQRLRMIRKLSPPQAPGEAK